MVRELGAESLVEFLPRVPACFEHWRDHAKEAGIEDVALREAKIVAQLLRESEFEVGPEGDGIICTINNPDCSHTQWVTLVQKEIEGKSQDQIKRAAVQRVARKFLVHLTADVKAAHTYGGSFGSTIPLFQKLLANRGENVGKVAFEVELPALDGLSTAQLIEVRLEYQDTFARFRTRLRSFLEECLQNRLTSPEDIQAKLKTDLIEGELAELRSNLKQAEAAFKRKSAYGLALGSMVAIIGVSTGVITPPVAYGLAATVSAASLSPGVAKYVDDMVRLKSDDMYFLLQAEAHQH
jgi:glycerophosphoryl diester phosphodiesterase